MNNRLQKLLSLLEKDNFDPFIYYGIALEYKSLNNINKTVEYLDLLLKNFPDYLPSYMQYGLLLQSMNKVEDAKKLFREGIVKAQEQKDLHTQKELEEFLNDIE